MDTDKKNINQSCDQIPDLVDVCPVFKLPVPLVEYMYDTDEDHEPLPDPWHKFTRLLKFDNIKF